MNHLLIASTLALVVGAIGLIFPPAAFGLGCLVMSGGLIAREG
jgi:hypothetical protein